MISLLAIAILLLYCSVNIDCLSKSSFIRSVNRPRFNNFVIENNNGETSVDSSAQYVIPSAFNISHIATIEDAVGIFGLIPIVHSTFSSSVTGELNSIDLTLSSISSLVVGVANFQMFLTAPLDSSAIKFTDYRSIYLFTSLISFILSWLLFRINTSFSDFLQPGDYLGACVFSLILFDGLFYSILGKSELTRRLASVVSEEEIPIIKYQESLLNGFLVLCILTMSFAPFVWTLAIRGNEWWDRVQILYPHQAAFIGVSLLVIVLGNGLGNTLARFRDKQVLELGNIVAIGVALNVLLLLVPEVVFHVLYRSGISEFGFYSS